MTDVAVFGKALAKPLNRRRRITVEVPEFVTRAIDFRVDEANEGDTGDDAVTFNDVVEWPLLEQSIPGFSAAMFVWLTEAMYQPPDED